MGNTLNAVGNRRIIGIISVFILFAVSIVAVEYVGKNVLNGVRGYIYGEGRWSKAQKEATASLLTYLYEEDEYFYIKFKNALTIIDGDRKARETLSSHDPDLEVAYEGFLQGGNHPDDIDDMIWIFLNFQNAGYIADAIEIWERGDQKIERKREIAANLRSDIAEGSLTPDARKDYLAQIVLLDNKLTGLEVKFSNTMNAASRWAGNLVFWVTISIFLVFLLVTSVISLLFIRTLKESNEKLEESNEKLEKSNQKITASEKKFRNVLNNSRDVIYQHDKKTERYDYISSSVKDLLGYEPEEVIEGGPEFMLELVHPDDRIRMEEELKKLKSRGEDLDVSYDTEFRVQKADGSYVWVNNKRKPVRDEKGNVIAIVGNVRDISDRKKQMNQIDRSLKDKQIMLAEIHHRVKNNLAIVSSLIEMQKWEVSEPIQQQFKELQSRIKSIALVHEKLYDTDSFSEIDLSQYIRELVEMISKGYKVEERNLDIEFSFYPLQVPITVAVPLGLMCNELVNNAFKHAFTGKEDGKLWIKLDKIEKGIFELSVTDNGGKLPQNFSADENKSLGMTLLNALAVQLEGELIVSGGPVTTFSVVFKA